MNQIMADGVDVSGFFEPLSHLIVIMDT